LHQRNLDHGYLGVSAEVAGLVDLAESGALRKDSIVLLLAAEYQLTATAVILAITESPIVSGDGLVRTAARAPPTSTKSAPSRSSTSISSAGSTAGSSCPTRSC